jgi:hypothetical protein
MWVQIWQQCHTAGFGGPMRLCWPDGLSVIEQPYVTIQMFDLIADEMRASTEAKVRAG